MKTALRACSLPLPDRCSRLRFPSCPFGPLQGGRFSHPGSYSVSRVPTQTALSGCVICRAHRHYTGDDERTWTRPLHERLSGRKQEDFRSLKQGRSRGWRRRAPPLRRRWRSRGRSAHPVWTRPGCSAGRKALEVLECLRCGGRRRVLAEVKGAGGVRAIVEHLGLPTASAHLAHAAPRLGKRLGRAGVCLLEMKGFCAGSACGSWAPRQRPSPPALLPPATPKRAPVLPMLLPGHARSPCHAARSRSRALRPREVLHFPRRLYGAPG
jgi:hypothetical protein